MKIRKGMDMFAACDDPESLEMAKKYITYAGLTNEKVQLGREDGSIIIRAKIEFELEEKDESFSDYLANLKQKEAA